LVAEARRAEVQVEVVGSCGGLSPSFDETPVADLMRDFDLRVRAGAPRRSQASSVLARLRRVRSVDAAISSRAARPYEIGGVPAFVHEALARGRVQE